MCRGRRRKAEERRGARARTAPPLPISLPAQSFGTFCTTVCSGPAEGGAPEGLVAMLASIASTIVIAACTCASVPEYVMHWLLVPGTQTSSTLIVHCDCSRSTLIVAPRGPMT